MSKRNIGDEIIEGLESAVQYVRGNKENTIEHKIERLLLKKIVNFKRIKMRLSLKIQ